MTSEAYSEAYLNAATAGEKADAAIVPIVSAVFSLVDDISANPVSAIVDLLPKVARLFSDNILNDQLQKIYNNLPALLGMFVTPDMIVIDPSMIIGLVNSLVSNIQIGSATLTLNFSDPDWTLLASTAKPVVVDSVSRFNAYGVGFETNKGDSFLVIFRYLFNNLTEQSNMASIKAVVKALVKDFVLSNILGQALDTVEGMSADEALVMVCNILDVPEIPEETDPEEPSTEDPSTEEPSTEDPSTEEPSTEEPSTEDPSTEAPATEDTATEAPATEAPAAEDTAGETSDTQAPANGDNLMLGAFAAIAVLAGAAVVITKKRK